MEVKTNSITVEWKIDKLFEFFGMKEEPRLDDSRTPEHVGLYLHAVPSSTDRSGGHWERTGFSWEATEGKSDPVWTLKANKKLLAACSSYFRTMFSSGFSESLPSIISSSPVSSTEMTLTDWKDDDSLEWLPQSYRDQTSTAFLGCQPASLS
ncbi:hypothetical protein JCM8547_008752 [Rhodosporidiobolus lusitaniae]